MLRREDRNVYRTIFSNDLLTLRLPIPNQNAGGHLNNFVLLVNSLCFEDIKE
jgi:hypothetical protein